MQPDSEKVGRVRRAWGCLQAIWGQRCPRCWAGRMFRSRFEMNDPCPVCGLIFEREEGYFLGAMYISYALAISMLVVFYVIASLLLPGWNSAFVALVAVIPYLPFVPAVYRYSRVLWVHYDRAVCPTELSAGSYEKKRLRQISEKNSSRGSSYKA